MNYPSDYIFLPKRDDTFYLDLTKFKNKKVLFVFGDSWTNNLYIKNPYHHWGYLLKCKLNYDILINISSDYDSNYEIFDAIKYVFCQEEFPLQINEELNELDEYKVVIEWSTPMRDSTSVAEMYKPYNLATIPDLKSNEPNTKLWMDYVTNWFRTEIYSYDTQKRILFLQHFFNIHNIDWYSFMGFTPLVEKEFNNSQYDFRKWIDSSRFLFLNGFPNNMQDYLIQQKDPSFNDYIGISEMQFENNRSKYFRNDDEMFTGDGHPNILGLEIMSNKIYDLIINK